MHRPAYLLILLAIFVIGCGEQQETNRTSARKSPSVETPASIGSGSKRQEAASSQLATPTPEADNKQLAGKTTADYWKRAKSCVLDLETNMKTIGWFNNYKPAAKQFRKAANALKRLQTNGVDVIAVDAIAEIVAELNVIATSEETAFERGMASGMQSAQNPGDGFVKGAAFGRGHIAEIKVALSKLGATTERAGIRLSARYPQSFSALSFDGVAKARARE